VIQVLGPDVDGELPGELAGLQHLHLTNDDV
jgi:hypothetical protein